MTTQASPAVFVEINTSRGPAYVRRDAITILGTDEWGNTVIHVAGTDYLVKGESLEQFKSRLRIAVVPAPREEGEQ